MSENTSKKPIFTVKQLTLTGLMAAVLCVLGPWALNIPISPVPISLGTLGIYFVIAVLGAKLGTVSVLVYILLGLVGLPVFSNFSGGAGKLLGPTGGYIIGYIFMALICGYAVDKFSNKLALYFAGMVLGTLACYLFGTIWLMISLGKSFVAALSIAVIPYIPGDIVKLILGTLIGMQLRKRLLKAGLLVNGRK